MTPEILKFQNNNTIPENFLLTAIAESKGFDYRNPVEIVFTVNGTQLSFVDVVNDWHKRYIDHMEELVEEKAKGLIKERTSDKITELETMLSKLKESVNDVLYDSGYKNVHEDGDYWNE
jgi:hypothetical protein